MKQFDLLPLFTVFITIFLAELGDQTQLATMLFAADRERNPYLVFIAASLALIAAAGISVVVGSLTSRYLTAIPLKLIAALGFIAIGVWMLAGHFKA